MTGKPPKSTLHTKKYIKGDFKKARQEEGELQLNSSWSRNLISREYPRKPKENPPKSFHTASGSIRTPTTKKEGKSTSKGWMHVCDLIISLLFTSTEERKNIYLLLKDYIDKKMYMCLEIIFFSPSGNYPGIGNSGDVPRFGDRFPVDFVKSQLDEIFQKTTC